MCLHVPPVNQYYIEMKKLLKSRASTSYKIPGYQKCFRSRGALGVCSISDHEQAQRTMYGTEGQVFCAVLVGFSFQRLINIISHNCRFKNTYVTPLNARMYQQEYIRLSSHAAYAHKALVWQLNSTERIDLTLTFCHGHLLLVRNSVCPYHSSDALASKSRQSGAGRFCYTLV